MYPVNNSTLNADAEPFYSDIENTEDSTAYRTHTLLMDSPIPDPTSENKPLVSTHGDKPNTNDDEEDKDEDKDKEETDSSSDSEEDDEEETDSSSDFEDDEDEEVPEAEQCSHCNRRAVCEIEGSNYCDIYQLIYRHHKSSNTEMRASCLSHCRYPNCNNSIFTYVESSKYADAGFYCKQHVEQIDIIMLEELTLDLALEDSKNMSTTVTTV